MDIASIVGGISTLSAALLGWFVYRRSVSVDKTSAQAGIASNSVAGTAQAFEGLKQTIASMNTYIGVLENDRKINKEDTRVVVEQNKVMQKELNRLYRKYGNGDTSNGV